jgi:transposase InsO family protein
LISDRGSHFLNDAIVDLTELFNINHWKTTPYHPQINGLIKKMNQTLVRILRKIVMNSKRDWDHKLTATLWAYRTTYKVFTHTTSFSLVFWSRNHLVDKVEVPSLRIAIDERLDDS